MSRSNYDKPFYVDIGTSLVAIRCASNHDVIWSEDHVFRGTNVIKFLEDACDRMNREFELYAKLKAEAAKPTCYWSVDNALAFANTLANHGWTRDANADAASSCIYALCRMLKDGGNAAAMREALEMMIYLFSKGVLCTSYADTIEEMEQIEELYHKAKDSLSAPPRNFDRFKTKEEAEIEFSMSDELPRNNGDLKMREWMCRFTDWLFATAAERKGESDGSK